MPEENEDLRRLLVRSLNKNQIIILNEIKCDSWKPITRTLTKIADELEIPLSTLKLNAKILRKLHLISVNNNANRRSARLTALGSFVVDIISEEPQLREPKAEIEDEKRP